MKACLYKLHLIIFGLVAVGVVAAPVIPEDRRATWTPSNYVGVIGGITNRTTVAYNAVTQGCDNTGVADCSTIVNNMAGSYVQGVYYFPAGTYKLDARILQQYQNGVTWRGAGMGQTILKFTMSGDFNGAMELGAGEFPRPAGRRLITSGATKGSTNVFSTGSDNAVVGKLIRIDQVNPDWVHGGSDHTNSMSSMHMVKSKTTSNVVFWPPLLYTLTNIPALIEYPTYLIQGVGFEDLTFDMSGTAAASAVFMQQAFGCWFKRVEVKGAPRKQLWFNTVLNCEVRECYTRDVSGGGPNHEGIDFYGDSCFNLIEDNICIGGGFPQIILGDWQGGCSGNVIGYNFISNTISGSGVAGYAISDNHGPHNLMNLIEGNVAQNFASDGYFGSSSHGTIFRNHFTGVYDRAKAVTVNTTTDVLTATGHGKADGSTIVIQGSTAPSPLVIGTVIYYVRDVTANTFKVAATHGGTAIDLTTTGSNLSEGFLDESCIILCHWASSYNIVGNVLGTTNYSAIYKASGGNYQDGVVYRMGFPNVGNRSGSEETNGNPVSASQFDTNVWYSAILSNNWNYVSNTISDPVSITMSNSYYLSAKPTWFSNVVWPPIGSDLSPMVSMIPAQMRATGSDYSGEQAPPTPPAITIGPGTKLGAGMILR